ncbi:hypothetical protein GHT07_09475 [Caenimonas koreensis DSM 17982]|uniref:Uncharacterized protein n=1 Tax=Caenimonas koreensis DSM 17982 TaxID=1121255 RepID=A0A844B7M5_9BURK|nr:hypothetical protein [Caenimonas koreensis]MRD47507.1 hypothetical protein [Caenimonas koreensis DSM 17982]
MRLMLCVSLIAALAGCSVVPPAAWTYDPTNPRPRPAPDQASAVQANQRIAELALEKNAIRARIAVERDAGARLALYEDLHRVGRELAPLERRISVYAQAR